MGARHPDRIPISAAYPGKASVRAMREADWKVIAICRQCRLKLHVNLAVVEIVQGPDFSLWNRSTPCKQVGCMGRADFFAMPPRCSMFRELKANAREQIP